MKPLTTTRAVTAVLTPIMLLTLGIALGFQLGYTRAADDYSPLVTRANRAAVEAQALADAAMLRAEDASAALHAVQEDFDAHLAAEDTRAENARQKPREARRGANRRSVASVGTRAGFPTRKHLEAACAFYRIPTAERAWVIAAGTRIASRESGNREGARNGDCLGLYQFDAGWGSEAQRLSGAWSCRRFVRAYRDGGKANIRRHWAATIGGL